MLKSAFLNVKMSIYCVRRAVLFLLFLSVKPDLFGASRLHIYKY